MRLLYETVSLHPYVDLRRLAAHGLFTQIDSINSFGFTDGSILFVFMMNIHVSSAHTLLVLL